MGLNTTAPARRGHDPLKANRTANPRRATIPFIMARKTPWLNAAGDTPICKETYNTALTPKCKDSLYEIGAGGAHLWKVCLSKEGYGGRDVLAPL